MPSCASAKHITCPSVSHRERKARRTSGKACNTDFILSTPGLILDRLDPNCARLHCDILNCCGKWLRVTAWRAELQKEGDGRRPKRSRFLSDPPKPTFCGVLAALSTIRQSLAWSDRALQRLRVWHMQHTSSCDASSKVFVLLSKLTPTALSCDYTVSWITPRLFYLGLGARHGNMTTGSCV